jgi:hypothetical protein
MTRCSDPTDRSHNADVTVWFRLAYGTRLPLWRVIPHRWMTRPCPNYRKTRA